MSERLTDTRVKNLKPKAERYKIWDSSSRGLFLLILPSGTKSWCLKYRINRKEKRLVIGKYPNVSIKHAREICFKEQNRIAEGIDVSKERKLDKQRFKDVDYKSFKDVSLAYETRKAREKIWNVKKSKLSKSLSVDVINKHASNK